MPIDDVGGPGPTGGNPISDVAHEHVATAQHGETVADIARRHGVEMKSLLEANPQLKDAYQTLNAGQEIQLPQGPAATMQQTEVEDRAVHRDLPIVKEWDKATPKLAEAAPPPAPLGDPTTKAVIQGQLQANTPGPAGQGGTTTNDPGTIARITNVRANVSGISGGGPIPANAVADSKTSPTGDKVKYLEVKLEEVVVSQASTTPTETGSKPVVVPGTLSAADMAQVQGGVKGESTDDKHKDWIEVLSYSHQISQPTSSTSSTAPTYTEQKPDGTAGGNVTAKWDLTQNKAS